MNHTGYMNHTGKRTERHAPPGRGHDCPGIG